MSFLSSDLWPPWREGRPAGKGRELGVTRKDDGVGRLQSRGQGPRIILSLKEAERKRNQNAWVALVLVMALLVYLSIKGLQLRNSGPARFNKYVREKINRNVTYFSKITISSKELYVNSMLLKQAVMNRNQSKIPTAVD